MIISIWRYSHLVLAIFSSTFILIAAITGTILALEPINNGIKPYAIKNVKEVTLAQTITTLSNKYDAIFNIEIDENNFVSASVMTKDLESETFYINPITGEKIGNAIKKLAIFEFATSLHRSLFLKSTGRFLVGLTSFLLLLIAITGSILIVKRQGSLKQLFSKTIKENFEQYYHIIIGKYTLIPIVIITITGVYLSLDRFSLLPDSKTKKVSFKNTKIKKPQDINFFKSTKLKDVKHIEFPFSNDPEDYFIVKQSDRELEINQVNGAILSEKKVPLTALASSWSLFLHTGRGNVYWSFILLLTSLSILFFMYSGFTMTVKRKKQTLIPKNKYSKDQSKYIILVGSESGHTYRFATSFFKALLKQGQSVFISELNKYNTYKKAEYLVVFTSTYGDGDAPSNAKNFESLVSKIEPQNTLKYAVIGFGSMAYPSYCKYAIIIDSLLQLHEKFTPNLSLFKINNQSFNAFKTWAKSWSTSNNLKLQIEEPIKEKTKNKGTQFKIIDRTPINLDHSFLIELESIQKLEFTSGDLLSITPKNESIERLYSIGKIGNNIVLSIKKHDYGICSNYLNELKKHDMITATIKQNKEFQFPTTAKEIIMISNGTGIAPFLGMINHSMEQVKTYLFWGGRNKTSFNMYAPIIDKAFYNKKLSGLYVSFSNEQNKKKYVQHLISEKTDLICETLKNNGVIMICGSVAMQTGVLNALENITLSKLNKSLSIFHENGQIKMDCY